MSKGKDDNIDFTAGNEYELTTVQDLMNVVTGSITEDNIAVVVTRNIGGIEENFVPSISVRSNADPISGVMIPNKEDVTNANKELGSYFNQLSSQTADKNAEYIVPSIFRVGGQTEAMQGVVQGDSSPHYISTILHHKVNGKSELVILDSLGSPNELNPSYIQEVGSITEAFKAKFGSDIEVKINPPGTVYQSDAESCGPICLYNLESRLIKRNSSVNTQLGIVEVGGVLKFEPGAQKLRNQQKAEIQELNAALTKLEKEVEIDADIPTKSVVQGTNIKVNTYKQLFEAHKTNPKKAAGIIDSLLKNNTEVNADEKNELLKHFKSALTPEVLIAYGQNGRKLFESKIRSTARKNKSFNSILLDIEKLSKEVVVAKEGATIGTTRKNAKNAHEGVVPVNIEHTEIGGQMKGDKSSQFNQYIKDFQQLKTSHQGAVKVIQNLLGDTELTPQDKADALKSMKAELTPDVLKAYGAKGREVFAGAFSGNLDNEQEFTPMLKELVSIADKESSYIKSFRISESNAGARADILDRIATDDGMGIDDKKALLKQLATQSFSHTDQEIFQDAIKDIAKRHEGLSTELSDISVASQKSVAVEQDADLADDTMLFADNSANQTAALGLSDRVLAANENVPSQATIEEAIDPITKAIREQIIDKQKEILKSAMKQGDLSKEQFDEYLKDSANKDAIHAQIDKDPELQKKLQAVEVAGYSSIHSNTNFNFKTVPWDGKGNPSDVRTQTVINASGEEVCKLTENTVKNPITLAMADGSNKTIQNYRKIDFPLGLDNKNGPMHVSMAVRDENGNKVPKDQAVYFTAHYDKQGRLTEVSSPVPLKFAGTDDDAIGYVERGGKIYTLPVTKKNYMEMMQEVAKNKGQNIDISKAASVVADDQINLSETRGPDGVVLSQDKEAKKAEPNVVEVADVPREQAHQDTQVELEKKAELDKKKKENAETDLDMADVSHRSEENNKNKVTQRVAGMINALSGGNGQPVNLDHKEERSNVVSEVETAPTIKTKSAEIQPMELVYTEDNVELNKLPIGAARVPLQVAAVQSQEKQATVINELAEEPMVAEFTNASEHTQAPSDLAGQDNVALKTSVDLAVQGKADQVRKSLSSTMPNMQAVMSKQEGEKARQGYIEDYNKAKDGAERVSVIEKMTGNTKLSKPDKLSILESFRTQDVSAVDAQGKVAIINAIEKAKNTINEVGERRNQVKPKLRSGGVSM